MITGINESRTVTKHISCECICEFDGRKHKSAITINVDASLKIRKNIMRGKKIYLASCYM